jgi:hypothetical protein
MYQDFHRALRNIGISDDEIAERHLHLHGWRHFLNTELLKGGLTIPQTQAVTRHKSDRMTEWYSHFDARKLADVMEAQQVITGAKKPGKAGKGAKGAAAVKAGTGKQPGRPDLKIVKLPERKGTPARKRA